MKNTTLRTLALSTTFMSLGFMNATASAQEAEQLPTHAIDCSQYPFEGYDDNDGNDGRDGVSDRALARSPAENNARLCSGLPIHIGDRRMHTSMQWNPYTNLLNIDLVYRPIGHNQNTVTKMVQVTYFGSPTPRNMEPIIANITEMRNGNATLGQAAANILPSATNGIGAATINALSNPCRNGGCNSGSTIVNMVDGAEAIAQSEAAVAANMATAIDFGSCGDGSCPTAVVPNH